MNKIVVEGWRGINHSYALVNQWQLLEMTKRNIDLRHLDVPYISPKWNRLANSSGLSLEQMLIIDNIKKPEPGEEIDISYRIAYPYNLAPSKSARNYVFGTSESQSKEIHFINRDPKKANKWDPNLFIVTPSRWSKIGFLKAGFDEHRVMVVPHGVDPETYFPLEPIVRNNWRKSMGIEEDQFVLLSLGTCYFNKGVELLVVAFAILRDKYPNLRLILKDQNNLYYNRSGRDVISDVEKSPYYRQINKNNLDEIIYISRNLSTIELRTFYGACDCYVSPYRAEGFNLTPLEAAACGTPILVTAGGSTDDYFHPLMGFQIEGRVQSKGLDTIIEPNLDSLIQQLTELIEGRKSVGGNCGSKYVHTKFSWARVCDQLLRVMQID